MLVVSGRQVGGRSGYTKRGNSELPGSVSAQLRPTGALKIDVVGEGTSGQGDCSVAVGGDWWRGVT